MKNRHTHLTNDAVPIKNSKDFVCPNGDVYTPVTNFKNKPNGLYYKKTINKRNGYVYVNVYQNDTKSCKNVRLHKLIALYFIPNPNNLPIVGHKNNIRHDNRIENLYWTTWSENIQKAVNEERLVNKKSFDDSQSKPVKMFNTITNELLGEYGSIIEASKKTGICKSTIARQAKYHRPVRKPFYFRYFDDKSLVENKIIYGYDYDTDEQIGVYFSIADASRKTNIGMKTIEGQLESNRKPNKITKSIKPNTKIYFLYKQNQIKSSKCEQTIEKPKA